MLTEFFFAGRMSRRTFIAVSTVANAVLLGCVLGAFLIVTDWWPLGLLFVVMSVPAWLLSTGSIVQRLRDVSPSRNTWLLVAGYLLLSSFLGVIPWIALMFIPSGALEK